MKRSWIGAGLLAVLLVVSMGAAWAMDMVHTPIAWHLLAAEEAAAAGNWRRAQALGDQAAQDWVRWRCLRGCLADHTPVEEVDGRFAQLRSRSRTGEQEEFAALAAEMAEMVQAMGQAHKLDLGSFF